MDVFLFWFLVLWTQVHSCSILSTPMPLTNISIAKWSWAVLFVSASYTDTSQHDRLVLFFFLSCTGPTIDQLNIILKAYGPALWLGITLIGPSALAQSASTNRPTAMFDGWLISFIISLWYYYLDIAFRFAISCMSIESLSLKNVFRKFNLCFSFISL